MDSLQVRRSCGVNNLPFIVLIVVAAITTVSGRNMLLKCSLGNSTLSSELYIKSTMVVEPSKTFAVVPKSTPRSFLCLSQACDPFSYIRDNSAYLFVKDKCDIPNGTTFSCVLIFPGLDQENVEGNSTVIRHSGNDCSPSLSPSTTSITTTIIPTTDITTTNKGKEGTTTHSTKEIPTKPSLTRPAVKPGNQDIDKDSSERFNNVVISCSVVIGILVLVIIFGGLYIYKLRKKYIYLVRRLMRDDDKPNEKVPMQTLNGRTGENSHLHLHSQESGREDTKKMKIYNMNENEFP